MARLVGALKKFHQLVLIVSVTKRNQTSVEHFVLYFTNGQLFLLLSGQAI